ncbi:MAG TPA: ABC transporter substrate-binding protein [Actinomycetota bacterium]|nr:ABC transporter substrate-binding protein [Actinomycetota bacterium]
MQKKRMFQLFAGALVLSLVAAACGGDGNGGGSGSGDGKAGGSAIAELGEPDGLAPHLCGTTSCSEPANRIFDSLLEYDWKTAKVVTTGAATSYEVSPDGTKITYQLRKGATFHNGEPVDAASFIRSLTLTASKDAASDVAYHLGGIKGFKDLNEGTAKDFPGVKQGKDEYELILELDQPNAEFFVRTGHMVFAPIPKVALAADGTFNKDYNEAPIGNGPYMVDGTWQHNVSLKLKKYADYNGPVKGFLDTIEFKIFEKLETAFLEFQGGTLDTTPVTPDQFDAAEAQYGDAFIEQATAVLTYLLANNAKAPTNNADFRRALSLAIDREEIVKAVFSNRRIPAKSIVPPASPGHRPDACKYCTFDLDKAKEFLQKAGGPKNINLSFNSGAGHEEWTAAVASQLEKNLGVKAQLIGKTPFGDYIKYLDTDEWGGGLGRLGWAQDYPTPDNWLFPLLHSQSGDNHSKYKNPEFDKTIEESQRTLDAKQRLALQQKAEDIALEDMGFIPMFYGKSARVFNKDKFASFPLELQSGNPAWEEVSIK